MDFPEPMSNQVGCDGLSNASPQRWSQGSPEQAAQLQSLSQQSLDSCEGPYSVFKVEENQEETGH